MKAWNEMRKVAAAFSKRWKNAYNEKTQDNRTISQISESSICTPSSTPMPSHVIVVMPSQ